jgi:hypothetical protein
MAIPNTGGGTQLTDGNISAIILGTQGAPQTATATATLTAAQVTGGILVGNPSTSAASYTLPTGAALDAAVSNAKVDSTFDLRIINIGTSSGVITIVASTGVTLVGMATHPITTAAGSSGRWRFRKTGVATWVAYRVA